MEKMNKKYEQTLKNLMKEEGLLHASPDFTSRVMSQVESSKFDTRYTYMPLIGLRGWTIIIALIVILVTTSVMVLSTGNHTATTGYLDFLEPVFDFIRNLEISVNFNVGTLFIGIVIFLSFVILLSVDFVFNTSINLDQYELE